MVVKFEFKKVMNGQYYFYLKLVNGEIIFVSEWYEEKSGVRNGIVFVWDNVLFDECYEWKFVYNGEFMFNLKVVNYQVIGMSEMYSSVQVCENGIVVVKCDVFIVEIVDFV